MLGIQDGNLPPDCQVGKLPSSYSSTLKMETSSIIDKKRSPTSHEQGLFDTNENYEAKILAKSFHLNATAFKNVEHLAVT